MMTTGLAQRALLGEGRSKTGLTKGRTVSFRGASVLGTDITQYAGKRKRETKVLCSLIPPESDPELERNPPSSWVQRKRATTDSYDSLDELWSSFYSAVRHQHMDRLSLERAGKLCKTKSIESEETITAFQQWIQCQNAASSPSTDHLLVLVKFNVFRALLNNGKQLGFSTAGEYLDHDALSPFVKPMRPEESLPSLPVALRPTRLQFQTPHHPCLDLLPDPVMRDNLIRANATYDEDQLCADLIGLSGAPAGRSGLVVWGEPWDPAGWEVTKPFLKHWGWALRGCHQLLQATNYWRKRRGEPSLRFEGCVRN
jgi:hypothetical protein